MQRDDSFLYSGVNSASNEPRTQREAQKQEHEKAYAELKPSYEFVMGEIAKEIAKVTDIRSFVIDRTSTEQEVNTELIARKLYIGYLNGLESKLKNIVARVERQPKRKKAVEDE